MAYPYIYNSSQPESIAYYSFDNYSGNTVYADYSRGDFSIIKLAPNGPSGYITGDTSFNSTEGIFNGFLSGCTDFSGGTGTTMNVGQTSFWSNNYHNDFAYNFYFKRKDLTSQEYWFINQSNNPDGAYGARYEQMWIDTNGRLNYKNGSDYNSWHAHFRSSEIINDTDWHMITFYYAGWTKGDGGVKSQNFKMFFDGVEDTTLTEVNLPIVSSNVNLTWSDYKDYDKWGYDSECYIDELSFWSHQRDYAIDYDAGEIENIHKFYLNPQSGVTTPILYGNYSNNTMYLTWDDDNLVGIEYEIYKKTNHGDYTLIDTVSFPASSYNVTGLLDSDYNFFKIRLKAYTDLYSNYSNEVWTQTIGFNPCLCESPRINSKGRCVWSDLWESIFTITNATCGNDDGIIEVIDKDYFLFFDFNVVGWGEDKYGNQFNYYINPTGVTATQVTGLTSGYYEIQITTKYNYRNILGYGCTLQYIPIENTDSTLSLTNVIKKAIICGPFDSQEGRIIWEFDDTDAGASGYTYNVYAAPINPYKLWNYLPDTLWRSDFNYQNYAFTNADRTDRQFYAIITNSDNNCRLLVGPNSVNSEALKSIAGIRRLFITPWSSDLDWNYWKTSDEDFYLESEDTSFFFSTKIKEYLSTSGGTLTWYNIPVMGTMNLSQSLSKVRQGILLEDTLNVDVPKGMIERFEQFTTLLPNKWVYVLEDNMGQWWTGGYQVGATIEGYTRQTGERGGENKYSFNIAAQSADKILTAVDSAYAISTILEEAGAPDNFAVDSRTINSITVEWDRVSYSDSLTAQIYTGGTWNTVASLAGNVVEYKYTNLDDDTTYQLRVINNYDAQQFISDTLTATTFQSQPQTITATTETDSTITVEWDAVLIYCDSLSPQIYTGGTWNDVATISSGSTSYQYTGLTSNTAYPLRVANNYQGGQYPSSPITGTTEASFSDGLIRYWELDNNLDGHGGVSLNGSVYSWDNAGRIDECIQFAGSSDVETSNVASSSWSLSFWFYTNDSNTNEDLMVTDDVTIYKKSGGVYLYDGGSDRIYIGAAFSTFWQHCVITYDDNTKQFKAYLDNSYGGAYTASSSKSISRIYLGYNGAGLNDLTGKLDEIGVWNRVLSASNVSDLYNGGNGQRPSYT